MEAALWSSAISVTLFGLLTLKPFKPCKLSSWRLEVFVEKKVEVPVHMRPRKPLSDDTGLL